MPNINSSHQNNISIGASLKKESTQKSESSKEAKRKYMTNYRKQYSADKKRVNITLSAPEYEALAYFAKLDGLPVTTLARDYVLAGMTGTLRTPQTLRDELQESNRLIRNIANNVNQMARLSNRLGMVLDENAVLLELSNLHRDLETFLAARLKQSEK